MKSKSFKNIVAEKAASHAFRFSGDRAKTESELRNVRSWKRRGKSLLRNALRELGMSPEQLTDDPHRGFDSVNVLKTGYKATWDCIVRRFEHDLFGSGLECWAVTTPDDTEVVGLFWRSD